MAAASPMSHTTESVNKPTVFKRRAPVACLHCRRRKVRCDVSTGSVPCTNCRLDSEQCMLAHKRRRLRSATEDAAVDEDLIVTSREWVDQQQFETGHKRCWPFESSAQPVHGLKSPRTASQSGTPNSYASRSLVLCENHESRQVEAHDCAEQKSLQSLEASIPATKDPDLTSYDSVLSMLGRTEKEPGRNIVLPSYILPFQQNLSQQTIERLRDQGAFVVPEGVLRDALLRTYVQVVYAQLPIIDLAELAVAIAEAEKDCKISLLVLQAIFYSATDFVNVDILTAAGFDSRSSARKVFYERARNLLDAEAEVDTIKVIHALLHLSSCMEDNSACTTPRNHSTEAVDLARRVRTKDSLRSSSMGMSERRAWRRTWWCCVVRDRQMALGHGPPHIALCEMTMPMLEIGDFGWSRSTTDLSLEEGPLHLIQDELRRSKIAESWIAMARLCTIDIPRGARRNDGCRADVAAIEAKRKLDAWALEFQRHIRYFMTTPADRGNGCDVLVLQQAILYSFYLALASVLHRSCTRILPAVAATPGDFEISFERSRYSSRKITSIYDEILKMDLVQLLPHTVVNLLVEASMVHLVDATSGMPSLRSEGIKQLRASGLVLRCLSDLYSEAGKAYKAAFSFFTRLEAGLSLSSSKVAQGEVGERHVGSHQHPQVLLVRDSRRYSDGPLVPTRPMKDEMSEETSRNPQSRERLDCLFTSPISVCLSAAASERGKLFHIGSDAEQWQDVFEQGFKVDKVPK